ncbi:hypothetical protein Goshw_001063 [Gossypium schwendimanii]|uniref:Uncharacterized protein n=1 Tax=Gossypium schwendimanii TaxID=34291 RepID=A0A7J9LJK8_GOSSC|nr:hypothetical protein [Gossypium schwendimanii]
MSCDEEYYLILHVGGHFVKDPYFRYVVGLQNNLRVVYDDTTIIAMLDFWVKFKEINIYVEDDMLLLLAPSPYLDKFDNKGEWSTYGDVEEINGVEADGEGVTDAQFEVDKHGGGQSGGLMIGVGNVVAPANGEEESKVVLDGNKTEVWDSDEHGSLVGSNED